MEKFIWIVFAVVWIQMEESVSQEGSLHAFPCIVEREQDEEHNIWHAMECEIIKESSI